MHARKEKERGKNQTNRNARKILLHFFFLPLCTGVLEEGIEISVFFFSRGERRGLNFFFFFFFFIFPFHWRDCYCTFELCPLLKCTLAINNLSKCRYTMESGLDIRTPSPQKQNPLKRVPSTPADRLFQERVRRRFQSSTNNNNNNNDNNNNNNNKDINNNGNNGNNYRERTISLQRKQLSRLQQCVAFLEKERRLISESR